MREMSILKGSLRISPQGFSLGAVDTTQVCRDPDALGPWGPSGDGFAPVAAPSSVLQHGARVLSPSLYATGEKVGRH